MNSPADAPKPRKPWGTVLALVLPGCGVLVALAVAVPLAWHYWPEFSRTPTTPARIDDPMDLLPAASNWVVGADLDRLRAAGTLEPMLEFITHPPAGIAGDPIPAGMADVVRDGQSLLIAGVAGDEKAKPVVILTTRGPADVEKIKKACHAGAEQKIQGFTAHRTQRGEGEAGKNVTVGWLAFPGDRLVVWSEGTEPDFAALLAAASKPAGHSAPEPIHEARTAPLWVVLHFDAGMKQKLQETLQKYAGALTPALQRGQDAILRIAIAEKAGSADVTLNVLFSNEADAALMGIAAEKWWQENKVLLPLAVMFMPRDHPTAGVVRDLTKTLSIHAQGTRAQATMQLSAKTLQQMGQRQK